MNRILFAAGGTAGHIEPAWAVSLKWMEKYPGDELAFLGTKHGLEVTLIPERGGRLFLIPKVTFPRKLSFNLLLTPLKTIFMLVKSVQIVKKFDVVVGFGGYVAGSAYLAARICGKPIVIHEQNAKAGIANRLGSMFTNYIGVAYSNTEIAGAKVIGNPLRDEVVKSAVQTNWPSARSEAKSRLNVNGKLLLILGGSQGAQAINQVITNNLELFQDFQVIHSLGNQNELPNATNHYHPVHYIKDVATHLLAADLIISRSGALATSEIAALGKYTVFIPLPVGNGEQSLNCMDLVKTGKAEMVLQKEFTGEWLEKNWERISHVISDEPAGGILDAAESLVALIESALK